MTQEAEVLAKRHDGGFLIPVGPLLAQAERSDQTVTQAGAVDRLCRVSTFTDEQVDRLGRTAIADATVRGPVYLPQIADVAQPLPCLVHGGDSHGARQLGHLEGEAGWRGAGVVAHPQGPSQCLLPQLPLVLLIEC